MIVTSITIAQPTSIPHWFQWVFVSNNNLISAIQEGNASQLAEQSQGKKLWLLIPSPHVLLTEVTLPNIKKSLFPKALSFALENQLACPLESLDIATNTSHKKTYVAAVNKEYLSTLLQPLQEIDIQYIYPATLCQPIEKNTWHIFIEKKIASIRTGVDSGFSCDVYNLYDILNSHLEESAKKNCQPNNIHIHGTKESDAIDIEKICTGKNAIAINITVEIIKEENTLLFLANNLLKNKPSMNFSQKTSAMEGKTKILSYCSFITMTLITILSLALLNKWLDYNYFLKKQTIVNEKLLAMGINPPTEKHLKKIQLLNKKGNFNTFNQLYSEVKKALYNYPAIIINWVKYEENTLTLSFHTKNSNTIDRFIKRMAPSLTIQNKSVEKIDNYWQVSLSLSKKNHE